MENCRLDFTTNGEMAELTPQWNDIILFINGVADKKTGQIQFMLNSAIGKTDYRDEFHKEYESINNAR